MTIKKTTTIRLSILISIFSSNIAIAAETADTITSSVSGWPLPIFFVILILFRKKIFIGDYPKDTSQTIETKQKKASPAKEKSSKKSTPSKPKKTTTKNKPQAKTASTTKDISDTKQCQASTAKGSRCKRTTTLETTNITIENQTYTLTVCTQHKNNKLKPFPGLIK